MKTVSAFYCLLCASWANVSASINAEGPEGGQVSFKCSHSIASPNTKYLCKDPCKTDKDKLISVKSGQRKAAGRIVLEDSGEGTFTVKFTQLQLSDSGNYWCAVDRPGFDSYIKIHLSVKAGDPHEAVTNATTVATSPTWTYQSVTNLREVTFPTDAGANSSQANVNGTGLSVKKSTVLYSTIGAIALLIILLLIIRFKKCKRRSRPQTHFCYNGTDLLSANEKQQNNYDAGDDKATRDPQTSASTAEESAAHIYENIRSSKPRPPARSRDSAARSQNNRNTYTCPLPTGACKDRNARVTRTTTNTTARPSGSCAGGASAHPSAFCSDSSETRSMWFGLDLSRTVTRSITVT